MRARRLSSVGLVLLIVLGFVLRLVPLGRYVTPDEPAWVERSIRFADALAARDWTSVPSTGHPGVTTMWLGGAGVTLRRWLAPAESAAHLDWIRRLAWLAPENGEAFRHLAFFLPYGRVAVTLVNSVGLLAVYWMLKRLFGRPAAFLSLGLLACDPFLAGHSGLLHTDGLLATFSFASLVAALAGLQEPGRIVWWPLSGFFGGLAILTKIPAVLILPFVLALLVFRHLQLSIPGASWATGKGCLLVTRSLLFVFSTLTVVLALHPGLWSDPVGTLRSLISFTSGHLQSVQRPIFFFGRIMSDPGVLFYPTVYVFRASPIVLFGVIGGVSLLSRVSSERRYTVLVMLAFALLYGVGISLGAKKHGRYILPVFPPLALTAALGLAALMDQVFPKLMAWPPYVLSKRIRLSTLPIPMYQRVGGFILILAQVLIGVAFAAHPLAYYNPLMGGPWTAVEVLPRGWGEGMGAAARWLNQRSDAGGLTVAASSVPPFASIFAGHTVPLEQAAQADYIARELPQVSDASSFDNPAAYTATVGCLEHAVVLTNTAPFEQAAYLSDHAAPDDLILLDADTPLLRRYGGPGELRSVASLPSERSMGQWLEQEASNRGAIWRVASQGASPITAAHLDRRLQDVANPVMTATVDDAFVTQHVLGGLDSNEPPPPSKARFGSQLTLIDGVLPRTVTWPDHLRVVLRWQAPIQPAVDYRVVVTLRDSEGYAWNSVGSLIRNNVNFPTSAWLAGEWADAHYKLSLLPGLPPGRYAVEVSVYDSTTGAGLGATDPGGTFQGTRVRVGEVSVKPTNRSPDVAKADVSEWLRIAAGPLTLLGFDPPRENILSGDSLSFSLAWRADAAVTVDHRVRFQLVGSDDQVEFTAVRPLSIYPTSRWRVGDWFRSYYGLHVPPRLPAGRYRLTLNVLDGQEPPLWEQELVLTEVEVASENRSFALSEEPPHQLVLTFGGDIHLVGYRLAVTDISPGGTLPLTLYWEADGPTDQPYTLFAHLLGPDGELQGQVDRMPGAAPTSRWAAGQVIVDEFVIPVAPDARSGRCRIVIGFYDAAYGNRLSIVDGSGELVPGDQVALPSPVTVSGE